MRSPLYTFRLLLGLICFSVLVACSGSSDSLIVIKPEIDTLNLYLDGTKIFSFNPETGLSSERAEFNAGSDMAFSLNTNEDKQGYETLAYVKDDTLFVMDYVTAKITPLAVATNFICGIFPVFSASQSSFDNSPNQRVLFHKPIITIATQNGASCGSETDTLFQLEFDFSIDTDVVITEINSSLSYGANILDFNSSASTGNGFFATNTGRSGFLGYDRNGQQVQLYDDKNRPLWETSLPFVDAIPNLRQITLRKMLVQSDAKLFVIDNTELFDLATFDDGASLPLESALDTLFDNPFHTLSSNDNPVRTASNNAVFYFEDGNSLYFFPDLNISEVFTRDAGILKLDFDITKDDTLMLLKTFDGFQVLSMINPETKIESTLFQADSIDFHILEDGFYVNTLNALGQTGWQAHWFDTSDKNIGAVKTTYDNSRFTFTDDTRTQDSTILMLSSDDALKTQPLLNPSLYAFDNKDENGRGTLFGKLSSDVFSVNSSEIINDIYGLLSFEALHNDGSGLNNVTETFYFNPTQEESSDNSLQIIKRAINLP